MNGSGNRCNLSLFRRYPELGRKLPYIDLGTFPTPVHPLQHLDVENLWIKRDDQSSSVYGGNKIRKLAFILAEARQKKIRHLISLGGIGTNHGLACALFSRQLGIKCTLLLYHQPVTANVQLVLLMLEKYKARLIYQKTLWRTLVGYYLLYRMKYPSAYFVYPGGSSALGTVGYVDAAIELKDQVDQGIIPEPGVIFCPLSSGGSLAGLALGLQLIGMKTRLIGVRVIASHLGPFQACTRHTVAKQMKHAYRYLKKRCRDLPDITIRVPAILDDFFGDGYGMPTEAGSKACHLMEEKEGITLDPTYTAKTFAAVLDYCRNQQRDRGPVLYWHTYNSVDLSAQAKEVDFRSLPAPLQGFIEQKPVAY
ncbi:MAG: pyridoxal-phosphate dependent enzyme [Desulfobacterales bacterium]|nr:MAG: pyridoxal-phosphate dependent enzyme [Desulfobacterales bacterium]